MHPLTRTGAAVGAALALLIPTTAAMAAHEPGPGQDLLRRSGHGAAVVEALGDDLPAAASVNRMSPTRLSHILEGDPTAWLGADGRLFYKEAAETLSSDGGDTYTAAAAYPASQTFALHSLPSSTHKIFLDFDGATVSGTWWNSYQGMQSRFYTGFTLDGDPATFTSAELDYIQQVWQIVAEKYSPFDVDVTTQDPGPDGYNRAGLSDQTFGDHVVITNDNGAVTTACGAACSGVALVDTFDDAWRTDSFLEPAWVFSSMTSGSAVLTAHTVAHEVGHTFGLTHDGDATHEYSSGQGNWFPIMGSSAKAVGQFSKGEYAGANNTQDDLAVIASNGAPLRADDRGDTPATATLLTAGTMVDGVISTRTDTDVFAVDHDCLANLTARVTGIGAGGSLDISVSVLNADGSVLSSADPTSGQNTAVWPAAPTGLDATTSVLVGNGRYYVRVDGVGKGDPSTGYSDYGSLGQYQLAVSACDGSMPAATTPSPTATTTFTTTTSTTTTGAKAAPPSAPGIGQALPGRRGKPFTATAQWGAPTSTGGAAITGYTVRAELVGSSGRVLRVITSQMLSAASRTVSLKLAKGKYRFRVVAYNSAGASPLSAPSRIVRAR